MDRTGKDAAAQARSVGITSAHSSHSERIRGRQTRYLISMGIRTACFVLAVVTDGAWRWGFIVAAVVLPYFAVIAANAAGEVDDEGPAPFVDHSRPMLEPGPSGGSAREEQEGQEQQEVHREHHHGDGGPSNPGQ
jgi:hypothetical protein